jgi:hypothetical protein
LWDASKPANAAVAVASPHETTRAAATARSIARVVLISIDLLSVFIRERILDYSQWII